MKPVKSLRFSLIDREYVTSNGEVVTTDFLVGNQHEILRKGGLVWPERGSKVAICKCGCGKAVFAAMLPGALEDRDTEKEFAEYLAKGHRVLLVPSEWVRANWTEHKEPEQLSLF